MSYVEGSDEPVSDKSFLDFVDDKSVFRKPDSQVLEHFLTKQHRLQMVGEVNRPPSANAKSMTEDRAYPVTLNTGWVVQYWPSNETMPAAMSTSAGMRLFGLSLQDPELAEIDDPELLQELPTVSLTDQAFETAAYMVLLAINQGWESIHLVDGTDLMKWSAWAVAQENNMTVTGYEPTDEDEAKKTLNAARLHQSFNITEQAQPSPGMQAASGGGGAQQTGSDDSSGTDEGGDDS